MSNKKFNDLVVDRYLRNALIIDDCGIDDNAMAKCVEELSIPDPNFTYSDVYNVVKKLIKLFLKYDDDSSMFIYSIVTKVHPMYIHAFALAVASVCSKHERFEDITFWVEWKGERALLPIEHGYKAGARAKPIEDVSDDGMECAECLATVSNKYSWRTNRYVKSVVKSILNFEGRDDLLDIEDYYYDALMMAGHGLVSTLALPSMQHCGVIINAPIEFIHPIVTAASKRGIVVWWAPNATIKPVRLMQVKFTAPKELENNF